MKKYFFINRMEQENNDSILTLYVWPSEWELPSLDAECLCAMV